MKKKDVPRGTSIIAQEFSPGRPDPTPLNVVQQKTTDVTKSTLDVFCEEGRDVKSGEKSSASALMVLDKIKELVQQTENDAVSTASEMEEEIQSGQIEVETKGQEIVIRVRENGSFSSGSARLKEDFIPIMATIRGVLSETPGLISVEGHSDSIPIRTARFRSNWDLSAARAVSVAHELMLGDELDSSRVSVSGFADSRPLVSEETPENRAINRRVEIVISQEEVRKPEKELSQDGTLQDIAPTPSSADPSPQESVSDQSEEAAGIEPFSDPEPTSNIPENQTEIPIPEIDFAPVDAPLELDNPVEIESPIPVSNASDDELF